MTKIELTHEEITFLQQDSFTPSYIIELLVQNGAGNAEQIIKYVTERNAEKLDELTVRRNITEMIQKGWIQEVRNSYVPTQEALRIYTWTLVQAMMIPDESEEK